MIQIDMPMPERCGVCFAMHTDEIGLESWCGIDETARDIYTEEINTKRPDWCPLKEQQPKTGHWLKKMSNYPSAIAMGGSRTSACDLCGGWGRKTFKYCPHCGAKMEEPTRT